MTELSRFILKLGAFAVVVLGFFLVGFFMPDPSPYENLHYALEDKHQALDRIDGRRIVLMGGSNVTFGVYSPMLEEAFDAPVVNTGLHAGYGLKFITQDVLPYLHEGDVVVLMPEYFHYLNEGMYGSEALAQLVDVNPSAMQTFTPKHWLLHTGKLFAHVAKKVEATVEYQIFPPGKPNHHAASRQGFNSHGDMVAHWELKQTDIKLVNMDGDINLEALDYLKEYEQQLASRGVKLFVSYPSLNRSSYENCASAIRTLEQLLQVSSLEVIGSAERYVFHDSLFYNTAYHLNQEGQKVRTQLLIDDLRQAVFSE